MASSLSTRTRPSIPRTDYSSGVNGGPLPPSIEGVGRGDLPIATHGGSKSNEALQRILDLAADLTQADRKQALDHLASLQATEVGGRDVEMWAHAIHGALVQALGASGDGVPGPLVIRRAVGAREAWRPVEAFMSAARLDGLMVAERQAVYHFLAAMLVRRAQEVARYADLPLGLKLVVNNAGDLAAIFDRQFPGYVQNGFVRMLVGRLVRGELAPG